ncbi:MAG: hypothetical protein AAGK37_17555 [Pseudomonadota bacterium]
MTTPLAKSEPVKLEPAKRAVANPPTILEVPRKKTGRIRRLVIALSFVLFAVGPIFASGFYLFFVASDQYHSSAAFSVRSEEAPNPLDIIGAFTQAGGTTPDSEILYDYIRSQGLVQLIDDDLDLRTAYNHPDRDPVFTLGADRSVEDVLSYWDRMVRVAVDANTGIIDLEVRAFTPEDAQLIAETIISRSADLVEDLSRVAREDAMRFTVQEVANAEQRLKDLRVRIRQFRLEHQIIDPEADVESQVGIISALQSSLAEALIDFENIQSYSAEEDPRLLNLQRRIDAIRNQIANERSSIAGDPAAGRSLTEIIGEYEELLVDLEFSQNAYIAALAAEEQARIEANRRSRYLAVHVPPTRAEESIYPQKAILLLVIAACAFSFWAVVVMIYYNVRDRR